MTQIVINPAQLAQTASALDNAAGEYQAIGAQVCGCDCGCMPADVAAVVDSVTADVRSSLQGISSELGVQASDLSQRAGVTQDGGFSAVSAAYGGASPPDGQQFVVGGGFDTSMFGSTGGGYDLVIGGGFDPSTFGDTGGGYSLVVGGGFDTSTFGDTGGGYSLVVGGGFDTSTFGDTGGGYSLVVGGGFDTSVFDGGGTGGGQSLVVGGSFDIPLSPSGTADGFLALAGVSDAINRRIHADLALMGPVYSNDFNPLLANSIFRDAMNAQSRLDVVMSPTYHDSSYFENRSDYLDQFPVDIRPY